MMPRESSNPPFLQKLRHWCFPAIDNLITGDYHLFHFLGIFFHDDGQFLSLVKDSLGFHPDKRNNQGDVGIFRLNHFEFPFMSVATPVEVPLISTVTPGRGTFFYPWRRLVFLICSCCWMATLRMTITLSRMSRCTRYFQASIENGSHVGILHVHGDWSDMIQFLHVIDERVVALLFMIRMISRILFSTATENLASWAWIPADKFMQNNSINKLLNFIINSSF